MHHLAHLIFILCVSCSVTVSVPNVYPHLSDMMSIKMDISLSALSSTCLEAPFPPKVTLLSVPKRDTQALVCTVEECLPKELSVSEWLSPSDAAQWWLSLWPTDESRLSWKNDKQRTVRLLTRHNTQQTSTHLWHLKLKWGPKTHLQLPLITIGAVKDNEMIIFEIITLRCLIWKRTYCNYNYNYSNDLLTPLLFHSFLGMDHILLHPYPTSDSL